MNERISRRQFLAASALTSAAFGASPVAAAAAAAPALSNPRAGAFARWLDGRAPVAAGGATWGMPWPRGKHRAATRFALKNAADAEIPLQTWPIAYWPDGSLKWTAHAVALATAPGDGPFEIVAGRESARATHTVTVAERETQILIDTGPLSCTLARNGAKFIAMIARDGRQVLRDGRLIVLRQNAPAPPADGTLAQEAFASRIARVDLEDSGPLRAVVKIEGQHASGAGRTWLPFTVRLYFYAGSEAIRMLHTIVFDGDEQRDFLRGIGVRFDVPMREPLHDRHVRFAGHESGIFAEAVRGLTGLRRNPGTAAREAQLAGTVVPSIAPTVAGMLDLIPTFGDFTLVQSSADAFAVRKRTKDGHAWLDAAAGTRAGGLAYVGGPSGGLACGIRNFWQSHPAQLDIREAASETAQLTAWVWAPDAPVMDLRFYHDGLGQDTYEKQLTALEITYEDYEPGFGTPVGVARTSELLLWALGSTPSRERFAELTDELRAPAVMVATPQTLHEAGVFGGTFAPPDRESSRGALLEQRLDWLFDFYRGQQEQHRWYGYWNYGDVMHTYDEDRHVWRYDVGGYAWDNSELSTDIWLWLYFLRNGRADAFRFAEAMTRHTGEVDVHHLGRFAPLGSRHNVMHWGCSAKQLRISTALNRRYYYYLTADERVGDLLREQLDAARTLRTIEPGRKLADARSRPRSDPEGDSAWIGFGTDWGSLAGAWLTEWERTRSPAMRERLLASMRTIGRQPQGFFTGSERMNIRTGAFDIAKQRRVSISHLSAAFGLPEVCAELIELLRVPEFERAWLDYCTLYNATADEQRAATGESFGQLNLGQGHSRLTAYAARRKRDAALARRAWAEFDGGAAGFAPDQRWEAQRIDGTSVLNPVDEAAWVSTNSAAQWGLAAIECLAFTAFER